MTTHNLFDALPDTTAAEQFEDLVRAGPVRIERIVSQGQQSPAEGWYDQDENEWILVVQGAARLCFADGRELRLRPGDHLLIPAHDHHRVSWTDPQQPTIWLAVFFP